MLRSFQGLRILVSLLALTTTLRAQTNTFPASGNVGVGTTSPAAQLHVSTNSYMSSALFETNQAIDMSIIKNKAADNSYGSDLLVQSAGVGANDHDLIRAQIASTANTRFVVKASGNVGIGTASPVTTFDVLGPNGVNMFTGPAHLGASIRGGNSNADYTGIDFSGYLWTVPLARIGAYFSATRGSYLQFGTSNNYSTGITNAALTIDPYGFVGIGTGSPIRPLHVAAAGTAEFVIEATDGLADHRKWNFFVANPANTAKALFLRVLNDAGTASTLDVMTWAPSGNVGIGTTTPGYPLTVNGAVRAKEVIVDTGWSDYVFEKSYRLAPLSEVEKRIKEDHHLPGIPSAQEVNEKGISVGQMQAKLLAKIEELTLHQIEQEKRSKAQEERILRLETENTALRSVNREP